MSKSHAGVQGLVDGMDRSSASSLRGIPCRNEVPCRTRRAVSDPRGTLIGEMGLSSRHAYQRNRRCSGMTSARR